MKTGRKATLLMIEDVKLAQIFGNLDLPELTTEAVESEIAAGKAAIKAAIDSAPHGYSSDAELGTGCEPLIRRVGATLKLQSAQPRAETSLQQIVAVVIQALLKGSRFRTRYKNYDAVAVTMLLRSHWHLPESSQPPKPEQSVPIQLNKEKPGTSSKSYKKISIIRVGSKYSTKVVVSQIHLECRSSANLGDVIATRAALEHVKAKCKEKMDKDQMELEEALCEAVARVRHDLPKPLVWQFSYDSREVNGRYQTPKTTCLEDTLQARKQLKVLHAKGEHEGAISKACKTLQEEIKRQKLADCTDWRSKLRADIEKELSNRNPRPSLPMLQDESNVPSEDVATPEKLPEKRRRAGALAAESLVNSEPMGLGKNKDRTDVIPKGSTHVFSDTFGPRRGQCGGVVITPETAVFPGVPRIFLRYLRERLPAHVCKHVHEFAGASLAVNCGFPSECHRDSGTKRRRRDCLQSAWKRWQHGGEEGSSNSSSSSGLLQRIHRHVRPEVDCTQGRDTKGGIGAALVGSPGPKVVQVDTSEEE